MPHEPFHLGIFLRFSFPETYTLGLGLGEGG